MADLIRRATIQKGFDPRDFVLFAFGGAGPMHAGIFARELGIRKVVVPQRKTASTWCAFGAAAADILHVYEKVDIIRSPFSPEAMNAAWRDLREHAAAQLARDGMKTGRYALFVDIRHRGQINEVEVPIAGEGVNDASIQKLAADFFDRYEQLYGRGSSFPGAKLEAVTFRCRATASTPNPQMTVAAMLTDVLPPQSLRPKRLVYWSDLKRRADTPVYDGDRLVAGNSIEGPAVVETRDTTVVVHPGQTVSVDKFGNFALDTGA
jgi:N-methylhydantoinase A